MHFSVVIFLSIHMKRSLYPACYRFLSPLLMVSGSLLLLSVSLSQKHTHTHTHTCTVHEIIATYTARCRSFSSLSPLPPVLLGFPAEQSSVSSTAGLELQGHTGKLKPPACLQSTSFFRWATFYPDLQDAQRGIGHSSQRAKN